MKEKSLIGVLFGIIIGMLMAQSGSLVAQAGPVTVCQQSKTIFRDSSRFSRKNNGAENMSKKHDEYTANGWWFVDMETYIENGDLEGFFLSYSREVPCSDLSS
jgi:hypothetical protein